MKPCVTDSSSSYKCINKKEHELYYILFLTSCLDFATEKNDNI